MLQYKSVTLEDKEWIAACMKAANLRGSEFTFANLFDWREIYDFKIARFEDMLIIKSGRSDTDFMYPVGGGDVSKAISALMQEAKELGGEFSMYGIPASAVEAVSQQLGEHYEILPVRDNFDYIYDRESLATLAGKKLHAKRNHINNFIAANPDWSLEPITQENIGQAWEMNLQWCAAQECVSHSLRNEGCAVENAFKNFFELGLRGAMLKAGGRIVAYTIGSAVTDDTFVVHIEKAFADVQGAYPMINREFVRSLPENYIYINREDDVGDLGLRKAKESYRPAMMYERYIARKKNG